MLKSEAEEKFCPMLLGEFKIGKDQRNCKTDKCMMWETQVKYNSAERKLVDAVPAAGNCRFHSPQVEVTG